MKRNQKNNKSESGMWIEIKLFQWYYTYFTLHIYIPHCWRLQKILFGPMVVKRCTPTTEGRFKKRGGKEKKSQGPCHVPQMSPKYDNINLSELPLRCSTCRLLSSRKLRGNPKINASSLLIVRFFFFLMAGRLDFRKMRICSYELRIS